MYSICWFYELRLHVFRHAYVYMCVKSEYEVILYPFLKKKLKILIFSFSLPLSLSLSAELRLENKNYLYTDYI